MVAMARCGALARYARPVSNLESSAFTGGHSPSPRRLTAYGCTSLPFGRQLHVVCCMHVASRPCHAAVLPPRLNLLSPARSVRTGRASASYSGRASEAKYCATQSGAVLCCALRHSWTGSFSRAHAAQVVRVSLAGFASYGERGHLGSLGLNACADRHNCGIALPAACDMTA
jgi:hypothetical protein